MTFKKGEKSPGQGTNGNKNGAPRKDRDLVLWASVYAPECIEKLVSLMRGDQPSVAFNSAKELLDRGFGRPRQAVEMTGADGGDLIKSITVILKRPDEEN